MDKLLSIGKIVNFHGVKGEVKVGYSEGDEHLFTEIDEIYAIKEDKKIQLTIEKVRFVKKGALIKFKEINSIDDAIEFKGALLKAPKDKLIDFLEEDEFYLDDLQGLSVYDTNGELLGTVSGVSSTKGQDMIFVKTQKGKEYIVPFRKELVPELSIEEKKLTINNIEGLVEQK